MQQRVVVEGCSRTCPKAEQNTDDDDDDDDFLFNNDKNNVSFKICLYVANLQKSILFIAIHVMIRIRSIGQLKIINQKWEGS